MSKIKEFEKQLDIIFETTWQQNPHTVVTIYASYMEHTYAAVGATVCGERDRWLSKRGIDIARGRALSSIMGAAQYVPLVISFAQEIGVAD